MARAAICNKRDLGWTTTTLSTCRSCIQWCHKMGNRNLAVDAIVLNTKRAHGMSKRSRFFAACLQVYLSRTIFARDDQRTCNMMKIHGLGHLTYCRCGEISGKITKIMRTVYAFFRHIGASKLWVVFRNALACKLLLPCSSQCIYLMILLYMLQAALLHQYLVEFAMDMCMHNCKNICARNSTIQKKLY